MKREYNADITECLQSLQDSILSVHLTTHTQGGLRAGPREIREREI